MGSRGGVGYSHRNGSPIESRAVIPLYATYGKKLLSPKVPLSAIHRFVFAHKNVKVFYETMHKKRLSFAERCRYAGLC
jgi:hypothetical protein